MKRSVKNIARGSLAAGLCFFLGLSFSCSKEPVNTGSGERIRFAAPSADLWQDLDNRPQTGYMGHCTFSGAVLDDTLFLHTSVAEGIETETENPKTRSAPVTSLSTYGAFGVTAFVYTGSWSESLTPDFMYNVKVSQSNSAWAPGENYFWPGAGKSIRFFAYAPYNGAGITLSPSTQAGSPTLTYTVPAAVKDQKDLLAAQTDALPGNTNSSASLVFGHILTAVKFSCGADMKQGTVKSITLKNVNSKGTYDLNTKTWSGQGTPASFTQTVDKATSGAPDETITDGEATFMMMPQTLPEGAQIEVVFNDGAADHTLTANINGKTWAKGTTVTYRISTSSINWDYTLEVTPPADYSYQGGSGTYTVKSFRQNGSGSEAAAWTAEYSTDGGTTWTTTKPAWLTAFTASGNGGTTASNYTATVAQQTGSTSSGSSHTEILQNATPKGSSSAPYDLSMYDVDGNAQPGMTTANCYVVRAPGTYRIPLVYGNAIKNGATNTESYNPGTVANGLANFVKHDNAAISAPCLEDNSGVVPVNATMVWNYANENFVTVNSALSIYTATIDGAGKQLQYIVFTIDKANIQQGNAVIAVRNSSNVVLWSWHIWVTDEDLTPVPVTNFMEEVNHMMPVNLGWCSDEITITYDERTCHIKITQSGTSGKSKTFAITQNPHSVSTPSTSGNCTYYQWGRKDPFLPSNGTSTTDKTCFGTKWSYSGTSVTIGANIQNPTVHYYNSSNYGPCNTTYYNMWSAKNTKVNVNYNVADEPVIKTVYDPCPPGFHVAPTNAFTGFTTTGQNAGSSASSQWNVSGSFSAGWNFYTGKNKTGGTLFFPASGYRSHSSGALVSVSSNGYFWAAVPYSTNNGRYLYFGSANVNPLTYRTRACGFPIRSVREREN